MKERLKFEKHQQHKLIKEFLREKGLSVLQASKFFNVGKTTFKNWLREHHTLPERIFLIIITDVPRLRTYETKIRSKLDRNWGESKGGKSRVKNIKNLNLYLEQVRAVKNKRRLLDSFILKKKREVKNAILSELINDGADLKYVLAVCLLTDGSLAINYSSYRIVYHTIDPVLKNFIVALLFKLSRFVPKVFIDRNNVYAIRICDTSLAKNLLKLSPSYKKNPATGQAPEDYLKEPQPSLSFIKSANEKTKIWCMRFAFSTDGSISISKSKTIELNFSCYNSTLASEWLDLFRNYGLNAYLGKNKSSWSNVDGVRIYDLASLKKFFSMGGFIDGVKISRKSKRYKGLDKNMLLKKAIRARSFLSY